VIIQIAGVKNKKEAELLINVGVTHIGFPLRLPVNKEDVDDREARDIIKIIPNNVHKVLITYLSMAKDIVELSNYLGTDIVQVHGIISVDEVKKTRTLSPSLKVIKSLIVSKDNFNELARTVKDFEDHVDLFITDTFDPDTGATGATGLPHDWSISKKIVGMTKVPVILAGGLNPKNVKQAIKTVRPAGVDAHTGVENALGEKDPVLVNEFVKEARANLL
jgi:phosphoribosylanthranilate isomerase